MIEFFDTYISPASSQRAKLAVWLLAQTSPEELAASTRPEERVAKLTETLSQLLSQIGVQADSGKLQARLESGDAVSGDLTNIKSSVSAYLTKDESMAEDQASQLVAQADAVLSQILPTLGITSKPAQDKDDIASTTSSEKKLPTVQEAVLIENVRAFKASMPVSEGARPVKDLSAFEDLEPKL